MKSKNAVKNHYSESALPNFGSTCYANAAFQLSISSTYFVKELETLVILRKGLKMAIPYFSSLAFLLELSIQLMGLI